VYLNQREIQPGVITNRVADFDFELPPELIAQRPPDERGRSRLLVLPRREGPVEHTTFARFPDHVRPGDLLVLNDTRVFPARLLGRRAPSGGAVECLLLRKLPTPNTPTPKSSAPSAGVGSSELGIGSCEYWDALVHPGQKLKPGARVVFEREGVRLYGEVLARHFHGRRTVCLWTDDESGIAAAIDRIGHVPLPPYITRDDEATDRDRYQTVYARDPGSVAAPTAGLHFTTDMLEQLRARGIQLATITLHVGYGTFKPVRVELVEEHEVDAEGFSVSPDAASALSRAMADGRRIIAVGTTTTRALESLTIESGGRVNPVSGSTRLFIRPGHAFCVVQGLVTNFHLPRSSLLMLAAAFAGRERILAAYREAVERRYRFYSYGDAMLIL
jgi:S-adenosylmethionine:tRNA ribosyltransferase-isomerase